VHAEGLSAEDYALIAELLPHVVWISDADRLVKHVNSWAADYVGWPAKQLFGWKWVLTVHPDDIERVRQSRDRAVRTKTPLRTELRIKRFDGQYRWHYVNTVAFLDACGEIYRWIGIAFELGDTTPADAELRVAERETEQALEFLKTLQADAPVGLSIVDREFRYVRINENLAATNAMTVEEHVGRPVADVLPELWRRVEPYYLQVLATGRALANLEVEGCSATRPGEVHRWRESCHPVEVHGEIIGVGAIVTTGS